MNIINKHIVIEYSAEQMYHLVNNIQNYPKFLPMCYGIKIFKQTEIEAIALLKIKLGFLKLNFSTHNKMIKNKYIYLNLLKGPFKSLTGNWKFESKGKNLCKVSLNIEFMFRDKFIEIILSPIFSNVIDEILNIFYIHAKKVYK